MIELSDNASIEVVSETALMIHFEQRIDADITARAQQLAEALRRTQSAGIRDIMPACASVLLCLDAPLPTGATDTTLPPALLEALQRASRQAQGEGTAPGAGQLHELPVCYGGTYGPDLDAVAAHCGLSPDQVVQRHSDREYQVAMLGFAPGFAYLLGLDESLHMPRRAEPRTRVAAGSIGIGGAQTGIYPAELPGGWQLLGRTPVPLFNAAKESQPARFAAGDRVRFVPIDTKRFALLVGEGCDA